jgi:hypothetical protein
MAGNLIEHVTPPVTRFVDAAVVNVFSPECLGMDYLVTDNGIPSTAWTANLLVYVPLITANALIVSQFFWYNGTAVSGNSDAGIYTEDGMTKLVSTGSTANAGTSQFQATNITDVTLPANRRLWLALGCDNGTQTYRCTDLIVSGLEFIGVKQQASGWSSGLPTSATFAAPSIAKMPIFGFTGKAVF